MLYVVATPIGNLSDFTPRAVEVLRNVSAVLCEDTRVSGFLLRNAGILTPLVSFHAHNEHERVDRVIDRLKSGESIALISDAGTPAISDPGYLLIHAAHAAGITVSPVPGVSAAIAALSVSGLPTDRFCFEGFLPQKKGRKKRISALSGETRTLIFYESPHRILKLLLELAAVFGPNRRCTLCREITKKFEEIRPGTLESIHTILSERSEIKGEIVLVVAGAGLEAELDGDDEDA